MNLRQFLFFGYILLFLGSCDCDDHELLINEIPSAIFYVKEVKQVSPFLSIQFNKNLAPSSVILNQSLTLEESSTAYNGAFLVDSNTIFIPICELMCSDTSLCTYEIVLENIQDSNGQTLDGDMDGNSGGLFIDTFRMTPVDIMDFHLGDFFLTCPGEQIMLDPGPFQSYNWSTGDTTRILSVTIPGSYSVELSEENNCSAIGTATVNSQMIMGLNAGIDQTVCRGDTVQLAASNGCAYLWRAFPPTFLSDSTNQNPTAILLNTTTFEVRSFNAAGAVSIDEVTITVEDFTPNAGMDEMICVGDAISLNATGGTKQHHLHY